MKSSSAAPNSFFTSRREKMLWLSTLVIIAGIYATLGLARPLTQFLQNSGVLAAVFILGLLLVVAAIISRGFIKRPDRLDIGLVLGIVAVYLLVLVRIEIPQERTHIIEYGVLAIFIYEALNERVRQGRRVPYLPFLAIGMTALFGIIDEGIQAFLPYRVFDVRDILFNLFAAVMAIGTSVGAVWVRNKVKSDKGSIDRSEQ